MIIEAIKLHTKPIWYNHNTKYYSTYLPTEKGRIIGGKHEGTRLQEKDKNILFYRINYFYLNDNKVISHQEALKHMTDARKCIVSDYKTLNEIPCCVYEYVDKKDNIPKYVGIVCKQSLSKRHLQHTRDDWYQTSDFYIRYFIVNSKSEAEAFESHLIEKHKTYNFYNVAKSNWGIISQLEDYEPNWLLFDVEKCKEILSRNNKRNKKIKKRIKRKSATFTPNNKGKRHMRKLADNIEEEKMYE